MQFSMLFTFLAHLIRATSGQSRTTGSYPPLEDVAKFKKVVTAPLTSTCGIPTQSNFCAPVDSSEGLEQQACNQKTCDQQCPGRDREKDPSTSSSVRFINVLDGEKGPCVVPDYTDVKIRRADQPSFKFYNDPACRFLPGKVTKMDRRGHFTMAVWLKQEPRNAGVIFEKQAGPRYPQVTILAVLVSRMSIIMQYLSRNGRPQYQMLRVSFPPNAWHHLAIQVYNRDVSVFIDGPGEDGTPAFTAKLPSPMADVNISPRLSVGQRVGDWNVSSGLAQFLDREVPSLFNSTKQYVGRMQDFRWFDKVLTNREIQEVATGVFPEINIVSRCLCPSGFPRVHPVEERFCIPNGVEDTDNSVRQLRLSQDAHPLDYITDDDPTTTWVSSTELYMPGGLTITIDLENGEYQVFYVTMQFYSPQPKMVTISRISNATENEIEAWGYFADDCSLRFAVPANAPLYLPTSVGCQQFPPIDEIPYRNSTITFSLLQKEPNPRPGQHDFYGTPDLMNFVKASKVQVRFQFQYFTQAESVHLRHQYYALKGIQVVGKCNCHGHAETCDTSVKPYQCGCLDESNTDGNMCERCKPLYNNKPYRMGDNSSPYNCQKCECNNHADSCHYQESLDPFPGDYSRGGGGVCDDCKHHTTGLHCEECAERFFRKSEREVDAIDACTPCACSRAGSANGTRDCEKIDGQCECKSRTTSRRCNVCVDGYYNLKKDNDDGCEECDCFLSGTVNRSITCDQISGRCDCRENVRGRQCSSCNYGFKNLTDLNPQGCEPCNCNRVGAQNQFCNWMTGQCECKPNVQGMYCDECDDGFWDLSLIGCYECGCDEAGTEPGTICDKLTGQCVCKANTKGRTCNECVDEYYNLSASNRLGCESCNCDERGTVGGSLLCGKVDGQCACKVNVRGRVCNLCRGNTFGLRSSLPTGCEPCGCDPKGTALGDQLSPHELVCDANSGQCACLPSREGRSCNQCSPGFYLPAKNESGCLVCDCHPVGSTSQVCNNVTGMCPCKDEETGAGLTGRRCDACAPTFWNFHHLFGSCETCGCDVAGSENGECNVITGQCDCKGNVIGQQCDSCRPGSSHLSSTNPMGCYSHPEQQAAPTESNVASRWILMTWNPPDHPNGDSLVYKLFRNSELTYSFNESSPFSESYEYNDTGLLPYTTYDYYIETSNIGGSVESPELRVRTLAGIPTGVPPLTVSNVRARRANFAWAEPHVAHGPIETYVLQSVTTEVDDVVEVHYRGLMTSVRVEDLKPFTNYTFTLRACTSGGCGDSLPIVVITPEDKPQAQRAPEITPLSNTSLQVTWSPPDESNGIIHQYEVMMRGKPGVDGVNRPLQRVVFRSHGAYNPRPVPATSYSPLGPPGTNFTQEGLEPFTEYEFLVSSSNNLGSTQSSWATARTLEGFPVFMPAPSLEPISSFEMNITWDAPHPITEARGHVVMYQVILTRNNTSGNQFAPPLEDVVIYSCGPNIQHFVATGFEPYSSHVIKMNLCNSVSCVLSAETNATTLPAAPEGQQPPVPGRRSETSIEMKWKDPDHVNGPRPVFALLRSQVAFSQPPIEMSRGVRFPGKSHVRFSPSVLPRDASYSGIQLSFRTFEEESLLFFAASPLSSGGVRQEYVVLQLRGGRPWFLFDPQGNPTAVTTSNDAGRKYNDGEWHRIEINRFNRNGYIEVDEVNTGYATSPRETTVIGVNDGVYVGGIPDDFELGRPDDLENHEVVRQGHIGCIKDIRVQRNGSLGEWSNVTWEEADQWHRAYNSWQGCPVTLTRPALHFLGRGHLKLSTTLGTLDPSAWSVEIRFRTEFSSGILFYAAGSREVDFMMATLQQGRLRYIVSTSTEDIREVEYDVINGTTIVLCDGEWHTAVFRNTRNRLSIEVDGRPGVNETTFHHARNEMTFDLSRDLYLGGVTSSRLNSLVTLLDDDSRSFGGCISHLSINRRGISLSRYVDEAVNVDLDGCPTGATESRENALQSGEGSGADENEVSSPSVQPIPRQIGHRNQCMEAPIEIVYTGTGQVFDDVIVEDQAFTRYLYKVTSSNAGGEAQSPWIITRSGEGIPHTLPAPYNERSVSGTEITVMWRRPLRANGVVLNYTLSATVVEDSRHHLSNISTKRTFKGDEHDGNMFGLTPYTNYSVNVQACTVQGCTTSTGNVVLQTLEEIPDGVRAPTADVNAHLMVIRWVEPDAPNGRITQYALTHNRSLIYTGLNTSFAIPGLPTFTSQRFQLEVCTNAGCNVSEEVTLYSGQLPPSHVDQPMVTVRGPHTVEVRWLKPAMMNGILDRYVLFLRNETDSVVGAEVYNSTMPILEYTLERLIAGTQYYVTLSACTEGGCKLSSATPCQTQESVPENVPPPDVAPTSPHSFRVSWRKPALPNGEITLYSLYQNDVLIRNSTVPQSTTLTGLSPWSRHTFRMRVCTKKGCSFGPEEAKRTRESPPEGRVRLEVTVLDSRALEARWDNPDRQNGRMQYSVICDGLFYGDPDAEDYSTARKSRVMTTSSKTDEWTRVSGLIPHSEYIVMVNASNGAGYVISNMRSVTMPPGAPDGLKAPVLTPQSPHSILATWQDPARNNAPGNSSFQLQYRGVSPPENENNLFDDVTRQTSYELRDLLPYKEYEFQVIASNSYGSTQSGWVATYTMQDRPSGMDPPIVYQINAWELRVTWEKPAEPNGVIEAYRVYENEVMRDEVLGNLTSFHAVDLIPFTTYVYRIEACTLAGCTSSASSKDVITHAAPPEGLDPPILRSDTPSSVFIRWRRPVASNGVLDNYRLERRLNDTEDSKAKMLGAFVPSQALRYLDESPELRPYTSYQYRVTSSTLAGGSTASTWTSVRTRPGRPAGIRPPQVGVLGPETAHVTWAEPIQANGPITRYEISFPDPRVTVENVTHTSLNVTGLIPYTDYEVSITACTTGGCTESPTTHVKTHPAVSRDLDPPILTPITERHVSVQWKPPKYPNGPDIFYELSRTITRQSLLPVQPPYINVSQTIYRGTDLMYEDRSLQKYTTCQYRLAVFNTEGSLASDVSTVTTLAGYPRSPGTLNVAVHNHTAVYLWWEAPSMQELQGEVHNFFIRYNSSTYNTSEVLRFSPSVTSYRLGDLHPGTAYTFDLVVDNGAHNVTSDLQEATTDDGAPLGLSAPVVYSLSSTQLRVSWLPPEQPNGRIVSYNVIINDVKIITNLTEPSSHVINDLKPYTIYNIKLEACTVYACAVSNASLATTLETTPTGIRSPSLKTIDSRSVDVTWKSPSLPNGILRSYQLKRRSLIPCSEIPKQPEPECVYVKCRRDEKVCGEKCFQPTQQVCCGRTLYDVDGTKECCDNNYVAVRGRSSDVCCGGKFHAWMNNRQCCSGRYLKVTSDEVCCKDPVEDRVSVGAGDSCCGGVPYFDSGLQVCCGGELHDAFELQCCGGKMISSKQVCCGGSSKGAGFESSALYYCCGLQYVPRNSTICCQDQSSTDAVVHRVSQSHSSTCCSTNLIPSDESCCNGVGYKPAKEVCADVATTSLNDVTVPPNCGEGTLCPLGRSMFAACDRCDFDREYFDCFRSKPQKVTSPYLRPDDVCPTSYLVVYSGPPYVKSFQDSELNPFTKYQYIVVAENKAGLGESQPSDVTTPQALPGDVSAPDWTSADRATITLSWKPPGRANGVITQYALMRDGLEIWSGHAWRHTDTYNILSYREYEYILKVCTKAGCTNSAPVRATSIQGTPEFVPPPQALVTGPYQIVVTWVAPPRPNGFIQRYMLNETSLGTIFTLYPSSASEELRFIHDNLHPYSSHTYTVTACTSMGCTGSDETSARTSEAPPSGVWHRPTSLVVNTTSVELYWSEPENPNGVITEYRLLRRYADDQRDDENQRNLVQQATWQLIHSGPPDVTTYTDVTSRPGARLEYMLTASNGAGLGLSGVQSIQLPRTVPERFSTVSVEVLGPTSISARWDDVITDDGDVTDMYYEVVLQRGTPHEVVQGTTTVTTPSRSRRSIMLSDVLFGLPNDQDQKPSDDDIVLIPVGRNSSHVINELTPSTTYRVRVRTCYVTSNVTEVDSNVTEQCNIGSAADARTYTAPPSGQPKPKLKATAPRTVDVSWDPPSKPNGAISGYRLYRRLVEPAETDVVFDKLIFVGDNPQQRSHTDADPEMRPYTKYQYKVVVINEVGEASSEWEVVTTLQDVPSDIDPPSVEAVSAFAVRAQWVEPGKPNGVLTSYRLEYQKESLDPTVVNKIQTALTISSSVYDATFSGLQPYTAYRVRLVAVNQAQLEGRSQWSHVTTLSAPPSEVGPLTARRIPGGESIHLSWQKPVVPNGEISLYNVYEVGFDETPVYSGLASQFLFRRLTPYTNYTLVLEACTGRDLCTRSPPNRFQTSETAPEEQPPPIVQFSNATAVMVSWSKPARANGRIVSYHVIRKVLSRGSKIPRRLHRRAAERSDPSDFWFSIGDDSISQPRYSEAKSLPDEEQLLRHRSRRQASNSDVTMDDGEVVYTVIDPIYDEYNYSDAEVLPYTRYAYMIRTATRAGNVDSDWVSTETHQAPPEGLEPPTVLHPPFDSSTSLIVTWKLPERINGILQTFRVQRNGSTPLSFPVTQFRFTDQDLQPYTTYSYTVSACTAGGCVISDVTTMRTYEEAPLYVTSPNVVALNSTAIEVAWESPEIANGIITHYRLLVDDVARFEGLELGARIGDLKPYTTYRVKLEACTNSGCRESPEAEVRTLEAPPTGLNAPELHVTSPNSIEIVWQAPAQPNGDIKRYEVRRDGELVTVNDGTQTRYHDFGLKAGTEYTYKIVAYNPVGSVESYPPVSETTDPSSPSGLSRPTLTPTSSSSIRVQWESPANPNGVIANYSLYVRQVTTRNQRSFDFPGSTFAFEVRGLKFFKEYMFWMQACTQQGCVMSGRALQRTMEAPPANQMPPTVTLPQRDQVTLELSWAPPNDRHGEITGYQIFRRRLVETRRGGEPLEPKLIINTTEHSYADHDLLPYTQYQYKVVSCNSAGKAPSKWSSPFRSGESPPEGVPAPQFQDVTSRSVRVIAGEPEVANGLIRFYHVFMKANESGDTATMVSRGIGPDQTIVSLKPFTTYQFTVEMCTFESLCTHGPPAYVTTLPAPPSGQDAPVVVDVRSGNVTVRWSAPQQQNGNITRYELYYRKSCPPPLQPFPQECAVGAPQIDYSGLRHNKIVRNLIPYTRYDFKLRSYNDYGNVESEWESAVTAKLAPVYVAPFVAHSNISFIALRWPMSFVLNSALERYEVTDGDEIIYSGFESGFHLRRIGRKVHRFKVKVYTDTDSAQTPTLVYDTTKGGTSGGILLVPSLETPSDDDSGSGGTDLAAAHLPIYQNIWFIVAMAAVVVVIVFAVLLIALRRMRAPERQRSPLKAPPTGRRVPPSGDIMGTTLPPYRSRNYSVNSGSSRSRGLVPLHSRGSLDSMNRDGHVVVPQDISFDQSMFSNEKHVIECDDQWERVYDDSIAYIGQPHGFEKRGIGRGDSGLVSNFDDDDQPDTPINKTRVNLTDTHL